MGKTKTKEISRRQFLGQASCGAVGSLAFYSTLVNLLATNRLSAQTLTPGGPRKALVCLFLQGGNDSFNLLVPSEASEYARYRAARTGMALASDTLLPIVDGASGRAFGLHPNAEELQGLFTAGDLAFVCNTGTLLEPTTLASYNSGSAKLPLGLYSHADQIMHWQTGTPERRGAIGWLGRMADVLDALNEAPQVSMNISLSGTNILQSGSLVQPYAVTPNGAIDLQFYQDEYNTHFKTAVDSLLAQEYQNLLQRTYSKINRDSIDLGVVFNGAIGKAPAISTVFPETYVGDSLKMVARSIAAGEHLGHQRQTFMVMAGGWDTHDRHLETHGRLVSEISAAVGAFWAAMGELGLRDQVALFSASDFGRTLSSNGDGTDHGWGGNQFVLGGGLRGGRLYGDYPEDIGPNNVLDTGRGRLVPTVSVEQYFAEMALWMGTSRSELSLVLPNLERFYDLGSSAGPLGLWA